MRRGLPRRPDPVRHPADGDAPPARSRRPHGDVCGTGQRFTSPSYSLHSRSRPVPSWSRLMRAATICSSGSGRRHRQGRGDESAGPVSIRRDLRERPVWADRRHAAHEPDQDRGSAEGRAPDIIVSFSYNEDAAVAGMAGVSYASSINRRGYTAASRLPIPSFH